MSGRGFFITLEGGEGTGKSTQIKLLADSLLRNNREVVITREPGGTPEAESIRNLLVHRDGGRWTPVAETLLFFAARQMHIENLIKPSLTQGKIVISDRFTDSTRAYQSYGHGLEPDLIESLVQLSIGGFEPDLTFILDLDVSLGLARAGQRLSQSETGEDRFEQMDQAFHERLRQGFLDIARRYPDRCVVMDANRTIEAVAADISRIAQERIAHV